MICAISTILWNGSMDSEEAIEMWFILENVEDFTWRETNQRGSNETLHKD